MNNIRTAVFIDSGNLWSIYRKEKRKIDFQKLKDFFVNRYGNMFGFNYYASYPRKDTRSFDVVPIHDFFTYLKKGLEFNVVNKALKQIKIHTEYGRWSERKG